MTNHPLRQSLLALIMLMAASWAWPGLAQAQEQEPQVLISVLPAPQKYRAGGSYRLAVRLLIPKGLHINSDRPPDPYMIPTTLSLQAGKGLSFGPARFPRPQKVKLEFSSRPLDLFQGSLRVLVPLRLAPDLRPGPYAVKLKLRYQACDGETCYMPAEARKTFRLQVSR